MIWRLRSDQVGRVTGGVSIIVRDATVPGEARMSATIRDLNRMSTPAGALRIGDNVPSSPQELMRALAIRRGTPLAVATRAV